MAESEYEKLLKFFSLKDEEKAGHFSDVIGDTLAFFNHFKEVMDSGSADDKAEMLRQAMELQRVMQSETENMCDKVGITQDELKTFSEDPDNFSKEQWEEMETAKGRLDEEVHDIASSVTDPKNKEADEGLKPKSKRHRHPSQKWIPS